MAGPIVYAPPMGLFPGGAWTTFACNASNTQMATFLAAENVATHGTINSIFAYCTAVTSPPSFQFSIQGITSRGTPDGVIKGVSNSAYGTATPSVGAMNVSLGTPFSATEGQALSIVIGSSSATGSANATFVSHLSPGSQLPYASTETTGAWTATSTLPAIGVIYNDGFISRGTWRGTAVTNNTLTYNGSSTFNSYGSYFTPNLSAVMSGAYVLLLPAAGSYVQCTLYEGSSTTVASTTNVSQSANFSCDLLYGSTASQAMSYIPMPSYTLKAGTVYRLMVQNSGTAWASFYSYSMSSAAALNALCVPWTGTSQTNPGTSFTDQTTTIYPVAPEIDSFISAGGLALGQGFNGGFGG